MNWKIAMLKIAQLGAFAFAVWIPFRMGRAGIRNPWPMIAGWFALVACGAFSSQSPMQEEKRTMMN
jgi:hypothetical protein